MSLGKVRWSVLSVEHLDVLKTLVKTDTIEVIITRGGKEIPYTMYYLDFSRICNGNIVTLSFWLFGFQELYRITNND